MQSTLRSSLWHSNFAMIIALGYAEIACISTHKTSNNLLHFLLISASIFLILLIAHKNFNFSKKAILSLHNKNGFSMMEIISPFSTVISPG